MVSFTNGRGGASCGGANISSGADMGSIQVEGLQGSFAFDSTCEDLGQMIMLEMRDGASKGISAYDVNNCFDNQDHDQQDKPFSGWGDGSTGVAGHAPMMMIPNPLIELAAGSGGRPEQCFQYLPHNGVASGTGAMLHNNFADSHQHACFVPQNGPVYQPAFGFVPAGPPTPQGDYYLCRGPPPPGVAAFHMMPPPPAALQHFMAQAQAQMQAQARHESCWGPPPSDSSSDEALNNNCLAVANTGALLHGTIKLPLTAKNNGSSCSSESGAGQDQLQVVPETAQGNQGNLWTVVPGGSNSTRKDCLARYKQKKAKRSFKKNIRYHMRKINADKRPRVKGRFIKSCTLVDDVDLSVSANVD
jgi:hypothetical protein